MKRFTAFTLAALLLSLPFICGPGAVGVLAVNAQTPPPLPPPPPFRPLILLQDSPGNKLLIDLHLDGTDAATNPGVIWSIYPPTVEKTVIGTHLIFTGPAGSYNVSATVILWDQKRTSEVSWVGQIGTPAPPIPPTPPTPPVPPTPPPPAVKVAIAYIVEDRAARTAASAAILGDFAFWGSLGLKEWHNYDVSQTDMPPGLADAAKKAGSYPALVLISDAKTNNFLRAVPLPLDKAAITAEVHK